MSTVWRGESYNDDRIFVIHVARCTVRRVENGVMETTIYHEDAPADHIWGLITFRNTVRYPIVRVDHFDRESEAMEYRREVEPTVPLISQDGQPMQDTLSYGDWCAWKAEQGWSEYDYRRMFRPGGERPREIVMQRAR